MSCCKRDIGTRSRNQILLNLSAAPRIATGTGLDTRASRACMLAETLAWSVNAGIPLPDALRSLPFYRRHEPERLEVLTWLAWMLTPTFYWLYIPWLNDLRWSARINRVVEDLEEGQPLGPTLQWWLGRFIPGFYLQGVMRAESDGCLETALPILAEQMVYPVSVTRRRVQATFLGTIQIVFLCWSLLFLYAFVAPRMQEILSDLGTTLWLPTIPESALIYLTLLLGGATLWVIGFLSLPHLGRWGNTLSHRIPWVSPAHRRFLMLDVSRTLAAYLREGEDLLTAAIHAEQSTPNHWLKRRLDCFIQSLRRGDPWLTAWREAQLGGKLELWALKNAEAREDPAAGFELIAQWTHQQIELATGRLERWLSPITTLVVGGCVGLLGVIFFDALVKIMNFFL